MNYVNIHGQPVTVDFRAMVRAIHPNACCSPAALSAAARSTTRRVYETDDFSNTALRIQMSACLNAGKLRTKGEQHQTFEDTLP